VTVFRYRVAGEPVASAIALPGLPVLEDDGPPVIRVMHAALEADGPAGGWTLDSQEGAADGPARMRRWSAPSAGGRRHRLRWDYREHAVEFAISGDGAEVRAAWTAAVSDDDVAALLAGPILGRALRLRGIPCLHATALDAGGRAVALLGPSRAGKSTLAAALVRAGCRLLGDDMAALSPADGGFLVHPGQSRLRLWADAAACLSPGAAPARVWPGIGELEKFVLPLGSADARPLPLAAVYVLQPRDPRLDAPVTADMDPPRRLVALAANVYGGIDPGPALRAREMALLARVAAAVPVRALTLPDRLDSVEDAARALLPHLASTL
jgi:hypothetical protein